MNEGKYQEELSTPEMDIPYKGSKWVCSYKP